MTENQILSLCRQPAPRWARGVPALFGTCSVCLLLTSIVNLSPDLASRTANAAESSPPVTRAEPDSSGSARRYTLKGKTEISDFKLNDLESYRAGMAALEKRNFSGAEILFKKAAAQLGEGYEKYRAECLYFQAKCLVMMDRKNEATNLYKSAAKLFEQHDPQNPYKAMTNAQVYDLTGPMAKPDKQKLHAEGVTQHTGISIDQNIILAARVTNSDTAPLLLRVDKDTVPKTVYNCFAEMTCLETAEIGSNINNAVGRWQPLLVEGDPAAFTLGAASPVIKVKMNGHLYKINLPTLSGSRKLLLATDNEKICAMDLDSYDTWLLRMKRNKDGSLQSCHWTKLTHIKSRGDSSVGRSVPSWDNRASGPQGWDDGGRGNSGWGSRTSGNSSGGSRASGNRNWNGAERGNTGWGTNGNGHSSNSQDSEEGHRHFSRDGKGGSTRGSSGF